MSDPWRRAAGTTTRTEGSTGRLWAMVAGLVVLEIMWIVLVVLGLAEGGEGGRQLWLPAGAGAVLVPLAWLGVLRRMARGVGSPWAEAAGERRTPPSGRGG